MTQYQRVALADIEKIEFGIVDQPTFQVLLYLSGITLPFRYKHFSGNMISPFRYYSEGLNIEIWNSKTLENQCFFKF